MFPPLTPSVVESRRAAASLVGLLLIGLMSPAVGATRCIRSCRERVNGCRRAACEGLRASARRRCVADCKGRNGCPVGIRTLAYAVTRCRLDRTGLVGEQEIQIVRRSCDPVTVARYATPAPGPDLPGPFGLCRLFGDRRAGFGSILAGVVHRLGVTPNGSGVVFEITNQFQLVANIPLEPEEQGFFFVRSDGTGLRRLGPPSRDPTYRISATASLPDIEFEFFIPFSPSGRTLAYTDLGPGPSGEETAQVFTLDVVTGERRQVTRLPRPPVTATLPARVTGGLVFLDEHTIRFGTAWDADGKLGVFSVRTDRRGFARLVPTGLRPPPGSGFVPVFSVTQPSDLIYNVPMSGAPANPSELYPDSPIREVFRLNGRTNTLQLTNFRRTDTRAEAVSTDSQRAFLIASADPFATNPFDNCQIFSVDLLGGRLRQLTRFDEGVHARNGCPFLPPPGCGIHQLTQDPVTHRVVFNSSCDPFGTNPNGYQVFAMRPDGSGLRQLTHTAGFSAGTDGTVMVEHPGPTAYSPPQRH